MAWLGMKDAAAYTGLCTKTLKKYIGGPFDSTVSQ